MTIPKLPPGSISENRTTISMVLGLLTGLVLLHVIGINHEDPYLRLIELKALGFHLFLTKSYTLMLFTTPMIMFSALLSFVFVHFSREEKVTFRPLPTYVPPEQRQDLYVVLGELHHPTKRQRAPEPKWLFLPERGLFTGIACFGAIGSGKTSAVIRPLARQLFAFAAHDRKRRLGGLVLEVKGDLCHQIRAVLEADGRADDYYELSLETRWRCNPLANPNLDEDATAHAITALIANLYGKSKDPFWPAAAQNLMKFIILLHRLVNDYVTLTDIYQTAIDPRRLRSLFDAGMVRYKVQETAIVSGRDYNTYVERLAGIAFTPHASTGTLRANLTPVVRESLTRARVPFDTEITYDTSDANTAARADQFLAVRRWFEQDWTAIDPKLRTSIVEGISVFLSLFDTNPAVKAVFCPPKEAFDPERNAPDARGVRPYGDPFPSFSELIEEGRVVALNFPVALNTVIARTLGILLKLDYQRAVLLRVPKMAADPERLWRPTVFLCDEYHLFSTVGESGTGDQNFFALSRQPKCIPIVATQSIVSLKGALSSDDAYRTLLQTFRTKLFLNTADDLTAEYASKLAGKEDQVAYSYNITEGHQGARTGLLTGTTTGDKVNVLVSKSFTVRNIERFPLKAFYGLRNAEAIAMVFDGVNPITPTYLYLKPWYLPVERSWWDEFEEGALTQ